MLERGPQRLLVADLAQRRTVGGLRALLGRILLPQHQRVHLQGRGQLVERALHRERTDRRAGRAIGRDLGPVRHHVEAGDLHVRQVVGRERAAHRAANGRARKGAGLQAVGRLHGGDPAVPGGPDLDRARRARRRAGGAEHLIARHHHLDRAARLARQHQRQRLQVDDGLAAETAADLGWNGANVAQPGAGELARHVAHHEVALAAAPDGGAAILGDAHETGVRLDIALMHGLGLEAALDDHLRRGEARLDVAQRVLELAGDIRRRCRARLGADLRHVLVQDGRARLQRLIDIDRPRAGPRSRPRSA